MALSLEEYAKQHGKQEQPAEDAEQMAAIAWNLETQEAEAAKGEELKASILQQLEQGSEPQYILYTAIKCIGLLSHDPEWTETAKGFLDAIYEGLEQESFIIDNAAIAAERLQEQEATYNRRLRTQLTRQLKGYENIAKGLNAALDALNASERADQDSKDQDTKDQGKQSK